MEVSSQLNDLAALPPGKEPQFPLDRMLFGPHSQPGHGGKKKSPFVGFIMLV